VVLDGKTSLPVAHSSVVKEELDAVAILKSVLVYIRSIAARGGHIFSIAVQSASYCYAYKVTRSLVSESLKLDMVAI
jgi:hypothetical protein